MIDPVEVMARELATVRGYDPDETWEEWTRQVDEAGHLVSYPRIRWMEHETDAQAALAALTEAGFAVVPVEPTARMCVAGAKERENGDMQLHRRKWQAMIAAAKGEG